MARLARHRRIWRCGLVLEWVLRIAGWCMSGLAIYGLFDYFIPVEAPLRRWINIAGAMVLAGLAVRTLLQIGRLRLLATACRLDHVSQNRRRSIQTACELMRNTKQSNELHTYLLERSIQEADAQLAQLPLTISLPGANIRRQARIFGLQLAILLGLAAIQPTATSTILARILRPGLDAPPYSPYVFELDPAAARVTYGGSLELRARISGAPLREPVWLLTRGSAQQHRTACFQETGDIFSQRLDHVTAPLEFAFAIGRARSAWQPVSLLLQPRVSGATLVITPPAYSRLPETRFEAGSQPLQALRGSRVALTLESNRPLLDGQAVIQPRNAPDSVQVITGVNEDPHTLRFEWILGAAADVEVTLRDIQGTASAAPFRLHQQMLADEAPSITLHEPQSFSLATPGARLTLKGEATDDLGLQHVELIQAIVGYRDRMQVLGPQEPVAQFPIYRELDLAALGVQPGDTLEFYAEALDTHPGLANLASSPIARVQIISNEEYADMLRMQITLREFMRRYQTMEAAMNQLREALETLSDSQNDNKQAALEQAVKSARTAERLLNQMATDFVLFDMEQSFLEDLQAIQETVTSARKELAATTTSNPRLDVLARHWHQQIAPAAQAVTEHREQAQIAAEIAELMEAAVQFRQLVQRQEGLVRSLERYENEAGAGDSGRLRSLGHRQDEIARDLATVLATIERTAPLLTGDAAEFAETALQFMQQLKMNDPETPMQAAVSAATNADGRTTRHQAVLALERLKQTGGECQGDGGFGGMCQGQGPPKFGDQDLQNTLAQMLAAMMARMLGGQDGGEGPNPSQGLGGSGIGLGGNKSDGYWMSGHSPLNLPVVGPPRTRFSATSQGATGDSGTGGQAGRPAVQVDSAARDATTTGNVDSQTMPIESIPAKYRDATKRYFSMD